MPMKPIRPLARAAFAGLLVVAAWSAIAPAGGGFPWAARAEAPATVFIEALGDVPLMPGLRLVEGEGLAFDAPAGRIVEAVAAGPVSAARVQAFYAQTLPQLGWRPVAGAYRRESENLRLKLESAGGETVARFFLSPAK